MTETFRSDQQAGAADVPTTVDAPLARVDAALERAEVARDAFNEARRPVADPLGVLDDVEGGHIGRGRHISSIDFVGRAAVISFVPNSRGVAYDQGPMTAEVTDPLLAQVLSRLETPLMYWAFDGGANDDIGPAHLAFDRTEAGRRVLTTHVFTGAEYVSSLEALSGVMSDSEVTGGLAVAMPLIGREVAEITKSVMWSVDRFHWAYPEARGTLGPVIDAMSTAEVMILQREDFDDPSDLSLSLRAAEQFLTAT